MSSTLRYSQALASTRGPAAGCPGTALPGGVTVPLVRHTDVLAAAPPSALGAAMPAAHPTTFTSNQHKTRISATEGGVSGSPPTWDPV